MDLEELQEKLHFSAQVGKELLERNTELARQNEDQLQEFSARTEELEQQNHQMRTELRLLRIREREAQDELREELERNRLAQEQVEAERLLSARPTDELKQTVEQLTYQLDEKNLLLEQSSEEFSRQASQVAELKDLLSSYSKSDDEADNQLAEMQMALTAEQCQRMEISAVLSEAQNQVQRLALDKRHLEKDLSLLKDSSSDQCQQVVQWGQALENSREEITALRSQLDVLQSSRDNFTHASSGNSIFGELEDERQKYEAEATTLRVKYRSLEKQHGIQRQQLRQLKAQLHALFQISRSRADQDELQRLKRKVAESSSVVQMLRARVAQLEDVQGTNESAERLRQLRSSFQKTVTEAGDTVTSDLYVEFLQRELELVRLREKETRKELETSRIQLIAEGDKLHQAESQIHRVGVELSKARSDGVQARLRLDEISQQQKHQQQQKSGGIDSACQCTGTSGTSDTTSGAHSHSRCGHECDSMYEHPSSPRLGKSPVKSSLAPSHTPCGVVRTTRRSSGSSPREPLQVLAGQENLPPAAAGTLQPKARPVVFKTPPQPRRQPKRQTVRIVSDEGNQNECSQQ